MKIFLRVLFVFLLSSLSSITYSAKKVDDIVVVKTIAAVIEDNRPSLICSSLSRGGESLKYMWGVHVQMAKEILIANRKSNLVNQLEEMTQLKTIIPSDWTLKETINFCLTHNDWEEVFAKAEMKDMGYELNQIFK